LREARQGRRHQVRGDVASRNAQIANEKILSAMARDEIDKGTAERQPC
jgi:hypothetical protein